MENKYDINLNEQHSGCGCGGGCCGGHHDHDHHHGGGCCGGHKEVRIEDLTEDENAFLNHLLSYTFLPVTRFVLRSTKEKDFIVHTLSPVYIEYEDDSMDKVKFVSEILNSLEEKGVISIDYDIKLKNYEYSEYYNSDLYKYFQKTIEEGKEQKNFLGDIAELETGSMAITESYADILYGEKNK